MNLNLFPVDAIELLRGRLNGRLTNLCFGAGVDSTAMMVALKVAGIVPSVITFADLRSEKTATYEHLERMQAVMKAWGWPQIDVVKKSTLETTGYDDLYGNCISNTTLPALSFGMKSCSQRWKQGPQDNFIKGVNRGPNKQDPHRVWVEYKNTGSKIIKLIGYDNGKADLRRSNKIPVEDKDFEYFYPLQSLGWTRKECVAAIIEVLGDDYVPVKSSCFFCPASKEWELYWLAANEPELLEKALYLERVALTGKHSRFDTLHLGENWEAMLATGDTFPSKATTAGLGRSFSWNQWALMNDVVNNEFKVFRSACKRVQFNENADALRKDDNAFDVRGKKIIEIFKEEEALPA